MTFTDHYADHASFGDTITTTVEGLEVTATIHQQYAVRTDEQKKLCGIVLSVSKCGILLEKSAASLWDCKKNAAENNNHLRDIADELLPEAVERGRQILATLCDCETAND